MRRDDFDLELAVSIGILQERSSGQTSSSVTSQSVTLLSNVTPGSVIHSHATFGVTGACTFDDSYSGAGNYTVLDTVYDSNANQSESHAWFQNSASGADTITAHFPSTNFTGCTAREIGNSSGYDTGKHATVTLNSPGTGTDVIKTADLTPSTQPGLLSVFVSDNDGGTTVVAGTSGAFNTPAFSTQQTSASQPYGSGNSGLLTEYFRYTATSALTPAATDSTSGGGHHYVVLAAMFVEGSPAAPIDKRAGLPRKRRSRGFDAPYSASGTFDEDLIPSASILAGWFDTDFVIDTGGGGPHTYNVSLTEAGSAADALLTLLTAANALTEAGSAADVDAGTFSATPTLTEAGSAGDTEIGGLLFAPTLAEAGSAADALIAILSAAGNLTESGSAADALATVATLIGSLTEAGTAADVWTALAQAINALTEAGAAADTLTGLVIAINTLAEAGSAADAWTNNLGGSTYTVTLTEAGSASDALSGLLTILATDAESGAASDALTGLAAAIGNLTESGAAGDSETVLGTLVNAISEAGAATDVLISLQTANASITEAASAVFVAAVISGANAGISIAFRPRSNGLAPDRRKLVAIQIRGKSRDATTRGKASEIGRSKIIEPTRH